MKATRKTIPNLIEKREVFTNDSSTLTTWSHPGKGMVRMLSGHQNNQMDDGEKARLKIDNETDGIAYLIISYNTPIAWETESGWVYKVSQTLSQTSEQHMGLLFLFHKR